jgi:hypothetical protein
MRQKYVSISQHNLDKAIDLLQTPLTFISFNSFEVAWRHLNFLSLYSSLKSLGR